MRFLAPIPRKSLPSEKTYITSSADGTNTSPKQLPCWYDSWSAHRELEQAGNSSEEHTGTIEEAEIEMSVVIPAYNEEKRLPKMLQEALEVLDTLYGRRTPNFKNKNSASRTIGGYEILIVNDGSSDKTVDVALEFARKNQLHDILRVCTLEENRGKGGAVTHGLRHVRGAYTIFADADGASNFEDLPKLVKGCNDVADEHNRGVVVGSRAHLVGGDATVKVNKSYNHFVY